VNSVPVLILALLLFFIGLYGSLTRGDVIRVLMSIAIILGSITLIAVALSGTLGELHHSLVFFVWVIEIMEVIVAVALFIKIQQSGVTIQGLRDLKW
jgi:NADH:ubiquinone oxidoreductase subunit K